MRRSMRAMVGAGALAVASVMSQAAPAHAAPQDTVTVAGWYERGPFSSRSACERARDSLAGLGYATRPCRYITCGTAPNCVDGWHFQIRR